MCDRYYLAAYESQLFTLGRPGTLTDSKGKLISIIARVGNPRNVSPSLLTPFYLTGHYCCPHFTHEKLKAPSGQIHNLQRIQFQIRRVLRRVSCLFLRCESFIYESFEPCFPNIHIFFYNEEVACGTILFKVNYK